MSHNERNNALTRVLYAVESVTPVDPTEVAAAVEQADAVQQGCVSEVYASTGVDSIVALYGLHKVNGRLRSGPQGQGGPGKGTPARIYNRP